MMTRALVPDLQHLQNSLNVENRKASSLIFIVLDAGLSEPKNRHSETKRKRGGHLALNYLNKITSYELYYTEIRVQLLQR